MIVLGRRLRERSTLLLYNLPQRPTNPSPMGTNCSGCWSGESGQVLVMLMSPNEMDCAAARQINRCEMRTTVITLLSFNSCPFLYYIYGKLSHFSQQTDGQGETSRRNEWMVMVIGFVLFNSNTLTLFSFGNATSLRYLRDKNKPRSNLYSDVARSRTGAVLRVPTRFWRTCTTRISAEEK